MISRLTSFAVAFAVIGAASLAFAAEAREDVLAARAAKAAAPVVQLERVVITAQRLPQAGL